MAGETFAAAVRRLFFGPSDADRIVADFARLFPDKCAVCSLARFQRPLHRNQASRGRGRHVSEGNRP